MEPLEQGSTLDEFKSRLRYICHMRFDHQIMSTVFSGGQADEEYMKIVHQAYDFV